MYCLDALLKGGFEKGKWVIFYDEKQNIYNPEYSDGMEIVESYNCTKFQLFVNCRNTVQIGTYSSKVSGVEIKEFLQANGEEVQKISFEDENDFKLQIKEIIKNEINRLKQNMKNELDVNKKMKMAIQIAELKKRMCE